MRFILLLALMLGADSFAAELVPGSRLLWEIKTTPGGDRIVQLAVAGDKLLCLREGVLYAFDPQSGKQVWRYPEKGTATRFTDSTHSSTSPFMLAVTDQDVITRLPNSINQGQGGCAAIHLDNGTLARQIVFQPPIDNNRSSEDVQHRTQLAFWKYEKNSAPVVIFDVATWSEVARFTLPRVLGNIEVQHGKAHGFIQKVDESFSRAFTLELSSSQLYSVAIRSNGGTYDTSLLPDGSRMLPEGRYNAKCGYLYPSRMQWFDPQFPAYENDIFGVHALDPITQKESWFTPLGYEHQSKLKPYGNLLVAHSHAETCVQILDAMTGALRHVFRPVNTLSVGGDSFEGHVLVACDGKRLFWAWPLGLKVYSLEPLGPTPNPADESDPAWYIARCREALLAGETEAALYAIKGVSLALRLRPEMRKEVALLLSQLSRSTAPQEFPKLWDEVVCGDGWVAGELFLQDYLQPVSANTHAAALVQMNTPKTLKIVADQLNTRTSDQYDQQQLMGLAMEAHFRLTGMRPWELIMARGDRYDFRAIFQQIIDDATLQKLLPELRKRDQSQMAYEFRYISPEQYLMLAEKGPFAEASRKQIESKKKGEGELETLTLKKPVEKKEDF